jgi:hypothetical protein
MVKGSRPPPVWMRKDTLTEVALMPATLPLSLIKPLAVVVPTPVYITLKPGDPWPPSLLLKVVKSLPWS